MKKLWVFLLALAAMTSLFADQAAWVTEKEAERGAALIRASPEIRHFCAPCGDTHYRVEAVSSVSVIAHKADASGDATLYEVFVNGEGVDLAYVYVLSGGRWLNAAILANIPVHGVPRVLPAGLREKKPAPNVPSPSDRANSAGA